MSPTRRSQGVGGGGSIAQDVTSSQVVRKSLSRNNGRTRVIFSTRIIADGLKSGAVLVPLNRMLIFLFWG